jgi:hypothetical protein
VATPLRDESDPDARPVAVTSRTTRTIAAGVAVVALYTGSAWISGQLSPLARRPLLDGLAPPTPYRWVDPPPELASTNLAPAPGTFRVGLGNRGSETAVLTTSDAQVTLILPKGSFPPTEGARALEVSIEPLAASAVDPPTPPLEIVGNVYRLEATEFPSGEPAELVAEARVVLTYPFSTGAHPGHTIVHSSDGASWTTSDTNDLPSIQQADAPIDGLGYVAVARDTTATSVPGIADGESSSVATIVIAAGLVVLAVAAALTLWGPSIRRGKKVSGSTNRRSQGSARGSRRPR